MLGLGSAIGAGIGAIGSIFGGLSASKAMKKVKSNLESQRRKNQDWYDRRYNEDATQRADAVRILNKTEESIRNRNKEADAAAAVMGGSDESVAAMKAANNSAAAEAAAQIALAGDRRKDSIESQYMSKDAALQQQLNDMEINRAAQTSNAIQGVASAGAEIAGALD